MRKITLMVLLDLMECAYVYRKGSIQDAFPDYPDFNFAQAGRDWKGSLCQSGVNQSPIDITSSLPNHAQYQVVTAANSTFTPLTSRSWPIPWDEVTVKNVQGIVVYFTMDGNIISQLVDGTILNHRLNEVHWLSPAEHLINGFRYALELRMVYVMDHGDGNSITGFNLSILFKEGKAHPLLDQMMNGQAIDYGSVFPDSNVIDDYYYYPGSLDLPFPDCWTLHVFIIPSYVLEVSSAQLDFIYDMYQNNLTFANGMGDIREVQPLGDRTIYHFISPPEDLVQSFLN